MTRPKDPVPKVLMRSKSSNKTFGGLVNFLLNLTLKSILALSKWACKSVTRDPVLSQDLDLSSGASKNFFKIHIYNLKRYDYLIIIYKSLLDEKESFCKTMLLSHININNYNV